MLWNLASARLGHSSALRNYIHLTIWGCLNRGATTDGDEKATLVPERTNPSELRQPALKTPVVCSGREQTPPAPD